METQAQRLTVDDLREHYAWVKRMASSLVRDPDIAGDLAQETWLAALESPPAKGIDLRAWLTGVVRNKALHLWRGERRRKHHEDLASKPLGMSSPPEELLASSETTKVLVEEVQALAEPFRTTLLLSAMSGLSSVEIAKREGVPEGTVRWRLKRGREQLAERLDARCGSREEWMRGVATLLLPRTDSLVIAGASSAVGPLLVAALALTLAIVPGLLLWRNLSSSISPDPLALAGAASPLATPPSAPTPPSIEAPLAPTESTRREVQTPSARSRSAYALDAGQAEVRVRFVDPAGAPLARVQLELPGDRGGFTYSNTNGHASLRFRPPSDSTRLRFFAGRSGWQSSEHGFTRRALGVRVRAGKTTDLGDITLYHQVQIQGRVQDWTGAPLAGASIFLSPPELTTTASLLETNGPPVWEAYAELVTTTDSRGLFTLWGPDVPLRVWAGTPSTTFASALAVTGAEPPELNLAPLSAASEIRGRVLDFDGAPLGGAQVRGTRIDAEDETLRLRGLPPELLWRLAPLTTTTAADGSFALTCRGTSPVRIRIRDTTDRWADLERELLPGTWEAAFRFVAIR